MREKVDPPFDQLQGLVVRGRGRPDRELSSPGTSGADTVWGVDLSVVFLGTGRLGAHRAAGDRVRARAGRGRRGSCSTAARDRSGRCSARPGWCRSTRSTSRTTTRTTTSGLPGLLKTYDLQGARAAAPDRRPARASRGSSPCSAGSSGKLSYDVELVELDEGEAVGHDGYEVRSFEVDHRMRAFGYALVEDERPGRFDPDAAARLGVTPGPDFSRLQEGESVQGSDGTGLARPGDGIAAPGPKGRDQRRYGSLRDDPPRRARGRAPRARRELRRRGDRARRRDRALDGPAGRRARRGGRREAAQPWCTSRRATTCAKCSPRRARRSRVPRRRATSTSSRSRSPSAASRRCSRTAPAPRRRPERDPSPQPSGAARSAIALATAIAWSSCRKCFAGSRIGSCTSSAS